MSPLSATPFVQTYQYFIIFKIFGLPLQASGENRVSQGHNFYITLLAQKEA